MALVRKRLLLTVRCLVTQSQNMVRNVELNLETILIRVEA